MKKFLVVFSTMLLLLIGPMHSYASATSLDSVKSNINVKGVKDSHTFIHDGEEYTLTLVTDNDLQTVYLESSNGVETVSYDKNKDELRFNGELADAELLQELKGAANSLSGESIDVVDDGMVDAFSDGYNWKHVKSYKDSFNVTVATVLVVTGIILLLPTGTGALAGAVLTAKVISVLASAIVTASSSDNQKVFYYTFDTYYSPKNGYWNNKFVLSVYKNSSRTQLVKRVEHTTPYGKKYD